MDFCIIIVIYTIRYLTSVHMAYMNKVFITALW